MFEAGRKILDCEIVELLFDNDAYQCYRASCGDGSRVRLLLVHPDPLTGRTNLKDFADQVNWLASQAFPCIGPPLKAGTHEGQPVCLYPDVPGTPLAEPAAGGMSVREALLLLRHVAECLSAPHSAGLRHGNLSPETIILQDQSPYLTDFALGQLIKLDYQSGIDPCFTSPEQVRGEQPGPPADIYNLGCVLFYLLTGRPPYTGDDAFGIAMQHVQGDFPGLPTEFQLCQPLLESLTELTPDHRLSAEQVCEQLTELLDSSEIDQLSPCMTIAADKEPEVIAKKAKDPTEEPVTQLSDSELAARIEAQLQKSAQDAIDALPTGDEEGSTDDVTEELAEPAGRPVGVSRFVMLLLVGIGIGTALYFLGSFPQQAPSQTKVEGRVVDAELDRGLAFWHDADYQQAEKVFKNLVEQVPQDPRPYNNLAALYISQGEYQQARTSLEQALATDPEYAAIYRNLGTVYAEMARDSYGKALQLQELPPVLALELFSSRGIEPLAVSATGAESQAESSLPQEAIPAVADVKDPAPAAPVPVTDQQQPTTVVAAEESAPSSAADEPQEDTAVVAVPEVVESSSQTVTAATDMAREQSAEAFLRNWAQAWSNQDIEAYLGSYSADFIPSGGSPVTPGKRNAVRGWQTRKKSRSSWKISAQLQLKIIGCVSTSCKAIRVICMPTVLTKCSTCVRKAIAGLSCAKGR